MRKALVALAVTAMLLSMAPAGAATQQLFSVGWSFAPPVLNAGGNDSIRFQTTDPVFEHSFTTTAAICADTDSSDEETDPDPCETGTFKGVQIFALDASPGIYNFFCTNHNFAGMRGVLRVT